MAEATEITRVAYCPRCCETHDVPMRKLTYAAEITVRMAMYPPLLVAKWTHWGLCPTFDEPIFHGLQPEYKGVDVASLPAPDIAELSLNDADPQVRELAAFKEGWLAAMAHHETEDAPDAPIEAFREWVSKVTKSGEPELPVMGAGLSASLPAPAAPEEEKQG